MGFKEWYTDPTEFGKEIARKAPKEYQQRMGLQYVTSNKECWKTFRALIFVMGMLAVVVTTWFYVWLISKG
jgi:hypothetical protein